LLLLLNFIDTITFFNQHQRETTANKKTGEVVIKTHPADIELAFSLLKNSLFRRADELSTNARGFYIWLQKFLKGAKTAQFTALDVRKNKRIHPRTLNRYLQELALFQYIQVTGGNKYREGYQYKITNLNEENGLNKSIENALQKTLENIKAEHDKQVTNAPETPEVETGSKTEGQPPLADTETPTTKGKGGKTLRKTKK
jgi:DNA-binding HxlR family transcriptional regulator